MKSIIRNIIKSYLRSKKVNAIAFGKNKGFRLRYNDQLNVDMLLGFHEPNTFEVFDLFLKEGMVMADLGANVGYFSRFLSRKVGPAGVVHSFEPMPETFKMLSDTIKLNDLKNVVLVNKAVSNEDGVMNMYFSHTHYMASLDAQWASKEGGAIEVPTTTLDSYFEKLNRYPDFIKMDIEGGGVFALKGMTNCILKGQPVLFLESHTAEEDIAIGKALLLSPYDVYRVGNSMPVKYLDKDYSDPYGVYGTVIGIPQSKRHLFSKWTPERFQKKRFGQRD